ncbi:MAG: hypothetical protein ACUZ8I_02215 [Candidatus Scalindua sp.]
MLKDKLVFSGFEENNNNVSPQQALIPVIQKGETGEINENIARFSLAIISRNQKSFFS